MEMSAGMSYDSIICGKRLRIGGCGSIRSSAVLRFHLPVFRSDYDMMFG